METIYKQLGMEKRGLIFVGLRQGLSHREIA
jgi:hypothetical protein